MMLNVIETLSKMREAVPVPGIHISVITVHENGPLRLNWNTKYACITWSYTEHLAFHNAVSSQLIVVCEDAWRNFVELNSHRPEFAAIKKRRNR